MTGQSYYNRYKRDKEAKSFYDSRAWQRCREVVLKRDNHLCQECLRHGRLTRATMVHHKQHYRTHKSLAYDADNLESLCASCHNREHPERNRKSKKRVKDAVVFKGNPDVF